MRHAYRQNLSIDLNLVAVEGGSPVDVFGAEHNWFFIGSMLQYCHMDGLVQF